MIAAVLGAQSVAVDHARAVQRMVDTSVDPAFQAQGQIHMVEDQERVAMGARVSDRLAELGGVNLMASRLPNSISEVFGRRARADDEAEADRLAMLAQEATRGFETPVINTGFSLDMLDLMPEAAGGAQWLCLTEALYFEARGESLLGQLAVAEVIMNRVDSDRFPDSICGVVRQGAGQLNRCQFSFYCDGVAESVHEPVAFARAGRIAEMMLEGRPRALTAGATHYHARSVNPRWARRLHRTAEIGEHVFYRRVTELALN